MYRPLIERRVNSRTSGHRIGSNCTTGETEKTSTRVSHGGRARHQRQLLFVHWFDFLSRLENSKTKKISTFEKGKFRKLQEKLKKFSKVKILWKDSVIFSVAICLAVLADSEYLPVFTQSHKLIASYVLGMMTILLIKLA